MDDQITHSQCSVRGCHHCHCHHCHTAALTDLKRLEEAKIDLDALLALYRDQQKELESLGKKCERLQIERDAVVENRDLTADERDEAMFVARELFDELRGVASLRCGVDWEQETLAKYPWLKEKE